jgi:hypothetical protein
MLDRVKGRAGGIETPTQLHWAALADTDPGGFQDRCLKPLGHPS